jgi:hypothetical protein
MRDGETGKTRTDKASSIYTDWAYIGMPIGPVTFEGGSMPVDITKWTIWDARADQALVKYGFDNTQLMAIWQKNIEFDPGTSGDYDGSDNDQQTIWGIWKQGYMGWNGILAVAYTEDGLSTDPNSWPPGQDVPFEALRDRSGWGGTLNLAGPIGPVAVVGEISVVEDSINGQIEDENGWGGYLQGSMDFGAASVTLNGGFTNNGYVADDDFGFIMIGGASAITPSVSEKVGQNGDTWWLGGIAGYQVSENLSLKGILAYADFSKVDSPNNKLLPTTFGIDGSAWEISGELSYALSDSSSIDWVAGWLGLDVDNFENEEDPYGTAVTFNVSF